MDGDTLPIRPADEAKRKRVRKSLAVDQAIVDDRVTLNVKISRKARMVLDAHAVHFRGTAKGTASGLVEALILEHLRRFRVSDHSSPMGSRSEAG